MDNGFAERAIRKFAIGRNNWMFADTESGAEASLKKSVMAQTKLALGMEENLPQDLNACVVSLFESLDPLGKQTFLRTLVWANSMVDAKAAPKHIVDRVESTLNLI